MKKTYRQPELVVYGAGASLTPGNNGCIMDNENQYDNNGDPIGDGTISGAHNNRPEACGVS